MFTHLETEGKFPLDRSVFYSAELVLALEYLHENGIVYRDIKTENILLRSDGHIVLTDFGLSKELSYDVDENAKTDTICGTPVYLSPEMIRRQEYNSSVDFWGLGILIYEMIVGKVPFYHENINEMFKKIAYEDVVFPQDLISTPIQDLITRLLKKTPTDRLTNFNEIKNHPFFAEINWEMLYKKEIPPPFLPSVKNDIDTGYLESFDVTTEKVEFDKPEQPLTEEEKKTFSELNFFYIIGNQQNPPKTSTTTNTTPKTSTTTNNTTTNNTPTNNTTTNNTPTNNTPTNNTTTNNTPTNNTPTNNTPTNNTTNNITNNTTTNNTQ